ncbi:UDP-2,4-diacetamido-2,4,6-trideoxy-beta-L-altropyranose hydrolase [Tabrizicola sp. TH137]|uniref:UDP-2,4-diacetamido-2,4, 6-trideoxy-beta-L-altropyranose hydrolase n=1 Tax=Tabrizicola sp. TH137 TaxID=2067452 RepID=UPI000C7994ED|nr:UDP-2,4-diacetamido-2,4,6-trideoxy-beta-L-altropyranose hydrolase [Tabrizicola sp. TH137]PLL14439.1 UDP-2,4-diacetamido-2,4,6-trideoxy-beta-L-altropyranose hydrolase [Tabrizicola sp. TH137]
MRAAFRADGAAYMGGGHIMRCLALANALSARGASCHLIARHLTDALAGRIRSAGHDLTLLPPRPHSVETGPLAPAHADWLGTFWADDAADSAAALGPGCDWLIVDHYALDARWHAALRPKARRILVIDDLADRPLACDALLDPNYRRPGEDPFAERVPPECHRFSSPQMALLDPAFAAAHARARVRTSARHAFLYLGTATADHHLPVLDALAATDLTADLVSSATVITDSRLTTHPAIRSGRIRLHGPQPSLLPFMERADLAIGPIGSSTWERFAMALPTLAVTIATNQERIAHDLATDRLTLLLGRLDSVTAATASAALTALMSPDMLVDMSRRTHALCDGRGAARLADALVAGTPTD